jgi:hypothetical protein
MKPCPYCGYANYDNAVDCRYCQTSFGEQSGTLYGTRAGSSYWVGPLKARDIRRKALSCVVLGLLMKVYWGGYGPWPVIDPPLFDVRLWVEPLLLYGGAVAYLAGWVLNRV